MVFSKRNSFLFNLSWIENQRGSFLLEALLAVLILSVGLVGLIRGLLASLNAAKEAEAYSSAIGAADNALLEIIRLNGVKTDPFVELDTGSKILTGQIEISMPSDARIPEILRQAQISAKWPGALKQKEVNAVTLVFGPSDEKK